MATAAIAPSPPPATAADPRWPRVLARDAGADGAFWYSVATTGVYCRPSCPSRAANPANVAIHDSLAKAKATGFRACRRCDPDAPSADAARVAIVARACRSIEASATPPALATLARGAGLSAGHFHRLFRRATGLTPRGYALAARAGRVRAALTGGDRVVDALHDAGFASSDRFYDEAPAMLGMAPAAYRRGGAGETLRLSAGETSLGTVLVASSARGVAAILLGADPAVLVRELRERFPAARLVEGDAAHRATVVRVMALIEEPDAALDLPLDIRGTAFQRRVWQALCALPAGGTVSYSGLAEAIGAPGAARAVAGACAANNLAVAIPCHRVVRGDGSLSGYAWGVERKRALIDREAAAR